MRGLEQTGRAQCSMARLDEGIKLTTFIPVRFVRHKSRKMVIEPTTPGRMASPLNPGRVKNMTELAKAEKVGLARMQKMLKLARLAPDIVDEIARGRQSVGLSLLFFVENSLPDDWNEQRRVIGGLAS